ncbi:hypothetical protein LCGC14_2962820 [marine sediment metagenome]|uniref:Uncharacterized protein n=1 Tax=marine sediment metagenome TaxID=412755 RepID=A0A0F8ZJH7_9ZZZZ
MTQHTEGPWIVSGTLKAGDDFEYVNCEGSMKPVHGIVYLDAADGPVVIARIHSPGLHPNTPDPTATCAANARLIAAAPELLEKGNRVIAAWLNAEPGCTIAAISAELGNLREAITKAETI